MTLRTAARFDLLLTLLRNIRWRWIEWREQTRWDAIHPAYWSFR